MMLITRIGDGGDYEEFDTIEELAEHFNELNVKGPFSTYNELGICSADFDSNNYISLYWESDAENAENPVHGIDDEDLAILNDLCSD
jgi:hypothetical protein